MFESPAISIEPSLTVGLLPLLPLKRANQFGDSLPSAKALGYIKTAPSR